MPFKSDAQRKFLWATKPEVAKKFAEHHDDGGIVGMDRKPSKVIKKDRYGNQITLEYAPEMKPLDPTALAKHAMDQDMEVPQISIDDGHPGEPMGSDTVPAWLTPGEFVVNAEAMRMPGAREAVESINNQGRVMQQMQGGSIPSAGYNQGGQVPFIAGPRMNMPQYQDDGGWITADLLDSLRMIESGGNNKAVSKAGAVGAYQWLPSSAKQAGYGVKAFDPLDEKAARAATAKYLKNMQKHHGFTPEETLQAYNWGPGNVLKYKRGQRKDIPKEAQEYAGKIFKHLKAKQPPEAMPTPRPEGIGIPEAMPIPRPTQEEMPMWKQFANKYLLGHRAQFKDNGGPIPHFDTLAANYQPPSNVVPALTDVPKGHMMFGGNQNIAGDVVPQGPEKFEPSFWDKYVLGPKTKSEHALTEEDKGFLDKKTSESELLASADLAEEENQIAEEYVGGSEGLSGVEEGAIEKKDQMETAQVDEFGDNKFKEEIKNKTVDKIDEIAKNDPNATGPGEDQKGPNANEEQIIKKAEEDPTMVEKAGNFLKEAFSDLFDPKELARAAILYAGSRALGYSHNGSVQYIAKNYLGRVDKKAEAKVAAAATRDKRAFELAKTDKFTPASVASFKKTGNPADLVSKKSVAGAVPTGVTEQRLIGGKKVSIQQVKLPDGSVGYNIPGKGTITKAQLENHSKKYDPAFDKDTSEYRTRRSRSIKSSTELFKEIQSRSDMFKKDQETKYRTGIIPAQAARDFWTFAESYGVDPESDEALDLMGAAYQQAIAQSSIEGAPVAKDLKPFLEAAYIRQQTGAPELFQTNPDKDVKEDAKYVRSDKMQQFTSVLDSIGERVLPKSTKTDARNQIVNTLVSDWGALSQKEKDQWNRKANKGIETGFYLYAKDKADSYLINNKLGE